jgi:hypothetical protein
MLGRAPGVAPLTLSTVVAAALGWATLLLVARNTDQSAYSSFAILWGVFYGFAGICAGLQQEVTRTTLEAQSERPDVVRISLASATLRVGAVLCLAVLATFGLWRNSIGAEVGVAIGIMLGVLGLTGLVVVLGALAAVYRWRALAGLLLADSALRILAVGLALAASDSLTAQAIAIGCASWVWLPLVIFGPDAAALRARLQRRVETRRFVGQVAAAMTATGCASLLIAGFPWLLAMTSRDSVGAATAGLLAALVLFRSPVIALVYGLRPLILRGFLSKPSRAPGRAIRAWLWCLVIGGGLAASAYLAGPRVLSITFGSDFKVSGWQAAGLVLSSTLLSMATISSLALLAIAAHRSVAGSWILAVVVTILVLALPVQQDRGVVAAAIVGPLAALAWHSARLAASGRLPDHEVGMAG